MTGYESKRAAARDKLDDDDTQVYQTELTKLLMESYDRGVADALEETKKALAQPAQEPINVSAKFLAENIVESIDCGDAAGAKATLEMLTALAQPAHPPQRPWVGLTEQEFQLIYDMGRTPTGMMEMVEAKLKEKNNG